VAREFVAGSLKKGVGWRKRNRERGRSLGVIRLDGDRGWEWNVAKPTKARKRKHKKVQPMCGRPHRTNVGSGTEGRVGRSGGDGRKRNA